VLCAVKAEGAAGHDCDPGVFEQEGRKVVGLDTDRGDVRERIEGTGGQAAGHTG